MRLHVRERVEKRIDSRESGGLPLLKLINDVVDVAGIRNQDLARGTLQEAERRGEGEDVIERKHGERGFLADHKGLGNPRAGLLDIREHIPMRQHGALCDAGRAAGVLKKRDIRVLKRHGAETGGVSLGECVAETDEMRHAEGRDHFFHVLHSEIHERPLEERKEVGNTGGNHRFNGGAGNGFFERFAESFGDDHHLRAAVSELIMQFAGGVEGVHVDRDAARLQNAEKGLMVLDVTAYGKAGHAARNEGVNAIYKVLEDIQWFRDYKFPKESSLLGPVKMSVTQINAGTQHNVIPDTCTFVVDIRSNECYSNEELFKEISARLKSEAKARSFRLNSSHISAEHPFVKRAVKLGRVPFGSPTLSDQALMKFPSVKIGPGKSSRSHTADEYIMVSEIEEAIRLYIEMLDGLVL